MGQASTRDVAAGNQTSPLSSPLGAPGRARPWQDRVTLLVHHHGGVEVLPLGPGDAVVVGRCAPARVRIDEPSLSREHACFVLSEGRVVVEDLGSTNGTWVDGQRITRCDVRPGDEVVLGRTVLAIVASVPGTGGLPGSIGYDRLRGELEGELARARCFRRRCTVLAVRAPSHDRASVGRFYPQLQALLREVDRTALYSPDTVVVLLPEADPEGGAELARRITAERPSLRVGLASFPESATNAEELLERCLEAAARATAEHPVQPFPLGTWAPSDSSGVGPGSVEPVQASAAMRDVLASVARLSSASIPVLLQGETGTGKEVVARTIHQRGPRRAGPMVCVNCGAIPAHLVESHLFGHERGAFTGAVQQQKGVFESAAGGSVLLDEIGELPLAAQVALLRVLETSRVTRVGSSKEVEVDVRLLAATHRDLEGMCAAGAFRPDLLYRLNAMTLTIPPLRQRPEDIPPLVERFLEQANLRNDRRVRRIEPEALELLMQYSWPGNVRELRNAVERAVVIAEGDTLTVRDLPERVRASGRPGDAPRRPAAEESERASDGVGATPTGGPEDLRTRMQLYEARLIVDALHAAGWNQTAAAQRLGLPLRTLVHKIKALGIRKLGYEAPRGHGAGER